MAQQPVVEIIGLDEVLRKLGNAASPATLTRGMRQATALVQRALAVYPPPARKPHGPWKSEKQRRYVMMLASEGQLPYRRTGTLGRRWTSEVTAEGNDIVGRVGNNTEYGPFVMGKETQAAYHAGVWPVAVEVAEQHRGAIVQCFVDVVQQALGG